MHGERTGPDRHQVIVTGLCGVLGAVLLVILLQIVHYGMSGRERARKVLAVPHVEYAALVEQQRSDLAAGVPIEEAMAEVVRRQGDGGTTEQRTER
ncbi:hypothetical protein KKG45_03680 [bacterium]|nr:hypothetical protein [bacterium]MBU1072327.1 hypothetical protein [bacterium]